MHKPHETDKLRLDREKRFHNQRFTGEIREAQNKYYSAIIDCFDDFHGEISRLAEGSDVLEYGCATGNHSIGLSPHCKWITGIDISDVAIDKALLAASHANCKNANFFKMDAENMSFADASFDLVFGSGIIHHLNLKKSFGEIARVLRPGGKALFMEPLGTNLLINTYRYFTPNVRTPDEHPLKKHDFHTAEDFFPSLQLSFYGLTTLLSVPFRKTKVFRNVYNVARSVDKTLFNFDRIKWQAWFVLMQLKK